MGGREAAWTLASCARPTTFSQDSLWNESVISTGRQVPSLGTPVLFRFSPGLTTGVSSRIKLPNQSVEKLGGHDRALRTISEHSSASAASTLPRSASSPPQWFTTHSAHQSFCATL